jgi:putative aldouronate transport system permease protein
MIVKNLTLKSNFYSMLNAAILVIIALICLFPMINVLAISFSSKEAVSSGQVSLWPVNFTLASYKFVLNKPEFYKAFLVSVKRVLVGVPVNMILTILTAYPLSKENDKFKGRNIYAWYFMITMLFSGGLITWYMTILKTGIIDSLAALILPGAVPVFNVLILMNFFRGIPKEIEEAAIVDGADQWTILSRIYVPLAVPCIATLILFCVVTHWNSWFDGIMLMNNPANYPLQSYLQTVIVNQDPSLMTSNQALYMTQVNDRTNRAAQVVVAALPVLLLYPFVQRYFVKGIVVGSVKG